MENWSRANAPFSIVRIFKYVIFRRRQKALLWSKGLSGHSKIDKTNVLTLEKWSLKAGRKYCRLLSWSLKQVESIAECSLGAFCNTFDLY